MIKMCNTLGYKNFCSACKGSREENGKLICRNKNGIFYGLPVRQVLSAPCVKPKKEETQNDDTSN